MTGEEYVTSVLASCGYPVTVGKAPVTTAIPYLQVWHISDIIQNSVATGQLLYQSSLIRLEYMCNTGIQGIAVGNAIRPFLKPPILVLQEGQTIQSPTTGSKGTISPNPGGDIRWFLLAVNLARIPQ